MSCLYLKSRPEFFPIKKQGRGFRKQPVQGMKILPENHGRQQYRIESPTPFCKKQITIFFGIKHA
jgi:hypothetical protein